VARLGGPTSARVLDRSLRVFFRSGVLVTLGRPRQAWQFARTLRWQRAAAKVRARGQKQGLLVPPIVIFSITHQCNLECAGCYARTFRAADAAPGSGIDGAAARADGAAPAAPAPGLEAAPAGAAPAASVAATPCDELSDAKLAGIVAEAVDLGVSFFVIAGGEPLLRAEILTVAECFPRSLFLLFTNGVLLDDDMASRMGRAKNVLPLLSLEGTEVETDERRGAGTYRQLVGAMARLRKNRLFFGCSLTLTSRDFSIVLADGYIDGLFEAGCRLFLFADYTPTDEATAGWALSEQQHEEVASRMRSLRKRHPALFVAVPWDEEEVGGCLSAGRGFVHINASGDLEPCPFSPYSDVNLNEKTLQEALRSPFLARLRDLPELSTYSGRGCALWKNRERVEQVLEETRRGPLADVPAPPS
jgi:MoaA/NifB/PqqE/SkfB family radical SAM enzyme